MIIVPDIAAIAKQWSEIRPAGGFRALMIDPPWLYENYSEKGEEKNAIGHYPCMRTEDIARLPVSALCADDCAAFVWCTWPMMPVWMDVIRGWDFEYAGIAWEWIKYNPATQKYAFGLGYGTRKNVEPCLLITRGAPRTRNAEIVFFGEKVQSGSRSVRDFIIGWPIDAIRAPRREHSRKPDEAATRIEALFDGPYLELFARERRKGWAAWGNELERFGATG